MRITSGRSSRARSIASAPSPASPTIAATTAYYVMDSVLRNESLAGYVAETHYWWLASLTLGPILGAVGACLVRSGAVGLLASLTVPVGALVQTTLLQPGPRRAAAQRRFGLW